MDERINNFKRARREGMRSRIRQSQATPVRVDSSLSGRPDPHHYGCAPVKNRKSRILTFPLAILISLAAWGIAVYFAMRFLKR